MLGFLLDVAIQGIVIHVFIQTDPDTRTVSLGFGPAFVLKWFCVVFNIVLFVLSIKCRQAALRTQQPNGWKPQMQQNNYQPAIQNPGIVGTYVSSYNEQPPSGYVPQDPRANVAATTAFPTPSFQAYS
jgi:hypothetical protein